MKKILFFLSALFLLVGTVSAQYEVDIPRKAIKEQEREAKRVEREAEKLQRDGWDIVPDPVEVPIIIEQSDDARALLGNESWQSVLQLPDGLAARIKAECRYPVIFYVSDSGADQTHRELSEGFVYEKDWTGEGHVPGQHGTHVTGIIKQLALPLFESGVAKWADEKSLRAAGSGSFAWATNMFNGELAAIQQNTAQGITSIWNCSWGGGTATIADLEAAMKRQVEAGAIIVAAAGNTGGAVGYPGNSEQVFGITSLDQSLVISSFSSRGKEVDGTAGGAGIMSTLPGNNYGIMSGTSMASPAFAAIFVGYARAKWGKELLPDYAALRAYYAQIAVQVGNGDPTLYGEGYPYIRAILDTRPSGGTPPPPPPPPPTDPAGYYTTGITDGYLAYWKREGENEWRTIYLGQIEWEAIGGTSEEDAHNQAAELIRDYFSRSGVVLTQEMGEYSAAWWAGQFLEYHANRNGLPIDVLRITATGQGGRKYSASGFDKASPDAQGAPAHLIWRSL